MTRAELSEAITFRAAVIELFSQLSDSPVPDWVNDFFVAIDGNNYTPFDFARWMNLMLAEVEREANVIDNVISALKSCEEEISRCFAVLRAAGLRPGASQA